MLTRTFLHLPRVSEARERRYWEDGILSWDQLLNQRDLFDSGPGTELEAAVGESRLHLAAGDARWFEGLLGTEHSWRMAADFDDGRIVCLDIETDGSPGDCPSIDEEGRGGATVVAVWDGMEARVFLRGRDLDELPSYLARYPVLCTFNGRIFDVPYLEQRFGRGFFAGAHLDLRFITRAVGLTGGLKRIERQLGIERPASVRRYTGYDAVKLWRAFRRGRKDALEPLARYNLCDAVNLQTLLRSAYNLAVAQDRLPFRHFDLVREEGVGEACERAVKAMRTG